MPDETKACRACQRELALDMFYRRSSAKDGRQTMCKDCASKYHSEYYQRNRESICEHANKYRLTNPELIRERKAEYYRRNIDRLSEVRARYYIDNRDHVRSMSNAYRVANRDKVRNSRARYYAHNREAIIRRGVDYTRSYRTTEKGRSVRSVGASMYIAKYPDRYKARILFNTALTAGKVVRPDKCQGPGPIHSDDVLHGHHTDYSKPLDVVWLCRKCHAAEHRRLRAEE